MPEAESAELYGKWTIASPGRPLFQIAFANVNPKAATKVNTGNSHRGPLLLIAGETDRTAPPVVSRANYKLYRKSPAVTEYKEMPGRGHSLTIDSGWREVAETSLTFLKSHSIT